MDKTWQRLTLDHCEKNTQRRWLPCLSPKWHPISSKVRGLCCDHFLWIRTFMVISPCSIVQHYVISAPVCSISPDFSFCFSNFNAGDSEAEPRGQQTLGGVTWSFWRSAPGRPWDEILWTWRFPELGVPLNQPFIDGIFHEINQPIWGTPINGKPPYVKKESLNFGRWRIQ